MPESLLPVVCAWVAVVSEVLYPPSLQSEICAVAAATTASADAPSSSSRSATHYRDLLAANAASARSLVQRSRKRVSGPTAFSAPLASRDTTQQQQEPPQLRGIDDPAIALARKAAVREWRSFVPDGSTEAPNPGILTSIAFPPDIQDRVDALAALIDSASLPLALPLAGWDLEGSRGIEAMDVHDGPHGILCKGVKPKLRRAPRASGLARAAAMAAAMRGYPFPPGLGDGIAAEEGAADDDAEAAEDGDSGDDENNDDGNDDDGNDDDDDDDDDDADEHSADDEAGGADADDGGADGDADDAEEYLAAEFGGLFGRDVPIRVPKRRAALDLRRRRHRPFRGVAAVDVDALDLEDIVHYKSCLIYGAPHVDINSILYFEVTVGILNDPVKDWIAVGLLPAGHTTYGGFLGWRSKSECRGYGT